jgi:hypothetical protein
MVITITGLAVAPFAGARAWWRPRSAAGSDIIKVAIDKNRWQDFNSTVGAISEIVDGPQLHGLASPSFVLENAMWTVLS